MGTGRKVVGILALWSAVVVSVLAIAATAAAEPCPAGQVPVGGGGVCVPLSPLLPGPTTPVQSPTATPTAAPSPSPTATSAPAPAPGGSVPGQPGPGATTVEVMPTASGIQTPENSPNGPEVAGTAAIAPSSSSPPALASRVPGSSAGAASGNPAAGLAARQQTTPGMTATAGYLLAFGGIMLLMSSGVGILRQRPGAY